MRARVGTILLGWRQFVLIAFGWVLNEKAATEINKMAVQASKVAVDNAMMLSFPFAIAVAATEPKLTLCPHAAASSVAQAPRGLICSHNDTGTRCSCNFANHVHTN